MFSDDATDSFRVFWGVPPSMPDASFHQLRAAGALLVSGKRVSGKTIFIAVESVAGTTEVIMYAPPDWQLAELDATPVSVTVVATGNHTRWQIRGLAKGTVAVLFPKGLQPSAEELVIQPVSGEPQYYNWWGQHEGGAGHD